MSRSTQLLLLLACAGVLALPVVTAHSLQQHLAGLPAEERPSGLLHVESLALAGLAALAGVPLARLGTAVARGVRASGRLKAVAVLAEERSFGGIPYTRVPGAQVSLFASGILHHRIYVTDAAEGSLRSPALAAGLRHELAHVRLGHLPWLALLGALRHAAVPLPGAARCLDAARLAAERQADDWALAEGAARRDLFDAIAAAGSSGLAPAPSALGAVGVEQRLRRIAGVEDPPPPLPVLPATLSALGLSSLPLLAHGLLWLGLVSGASWHHTM